MALDYLFLGSKIQQLRSERKISQIKFAEMIDTSPTFVSRMERGMKGPSLETLILIADSLDVSIDSLLAESRTQSRLANDSELSAILEDCSAFERYVLLQTVKEIKRILRAGESIRINSHSLF